MYLLPILLTLPTLLLAAPQSLTIHTGPADSSAPSSLAQITYDPEALAASITSYTPPSVPADTTIPSLRRVGLYDSASQKWRGVATAASAFDPQFQKRILLHVDEKGEVYHVGFSTSGRGVAPGAKAKGVSVRDEEVVVEVVVRGKGPGPVLNKPVVLSPEGKVESKEPEKTFLQKYWWAIALFLLVQVVAGGGQSDSK